MAVLSNSRIGLKKGHSEKPGGGGLGSVPRGAPAELNAEGHVGRHSGRGSGESMWKEEHGVAPGKVNQEPQ